MAVSPLSEMSDEEYEKVIQEGAEKWRKLIAPQFDEQGNPIKFDPGAVMIAGVEAMGAVGMAMAAVESQKETLTKRIQALLSDLEEKGTLSPKQAEGVRVAGNKEKSGGHLAMQAALKELDIPAVNEALRNVNSRERG